MKKDKKHITLSMRNVGMIPVFNHTDIETCKKVLDATYRGGVRVFEFTNRTDNSLEVFTELYKYAQKYTDLILGIGTIFTKEQTEKYIAAGADFIVSPALIEEVITTCYENDILAIPGCATLTEVYNASQLGCQTVKAFPGNLLGPAFVKSIKSVLPNIEVMPTGGVKPTKENLSEWFHSGVICVGMGSQLFSKTDIDSGNFDKLSTDIKQALWLIDEIRKN